MSTTVSVSNYAYQGQVFSPAFSEPASPISDTSASPPASPRSDDGDDPTCYNVKDKKRPSRVNRDIEDDLEFVTKKPKYANKYEAMLRPLRPSTVIKPKSLPVKTHKSPVDERLQERFHELADLAEPSEVDAFLSQHLNVLEVDKYNSDGRTAMQQAVLDGNLELAKVLVKYGANFRLTTRDGFSPFHLAVYAGHSGLMMYISQLNRP